MSALTRKIKEFFCLAGDIAMLYLALFLTLLIRYGYDWRENWRSHFLPFTLIFFFSLIIFYILGLYDLSLARNNLYFFTVLTKALVISTVLAILFFYFIPYFGIAPKTNLLISFGIFAVLFFFWRQFYNRFIKSPGLMNNVLVLGQNEETKELVQYIKTNPQLGYRIKKIVSADDVKILYDLIETIIQEKIQTVVITANPHEDKNLSRNLYQCIPLKITVADMPLFYEKITGKIPVSSIGEMWFLQNLMNSHKIFFGGAKRCADIFFTLIIGFFTFVLTPFIALLIKIDSVGPVFIWQKRVGIDNKIFKIAKFRSMLALAPDGSAEKNGAQWSDEKDKRITRVGKWLRKTRLDELPQIWNVLKGEMSFVGPRPERPEFAFSNELLSRVPFYQVRHSIKPGLTGWAQIKYPYGSSVEDTLQKLQYDLYYIKNRSAALDLAITLKTIKIILSGGGR
ncbi:MAG: sugar transferase [Candidatus Portnoybacteria bacterium]|nr:sugar transferase [Candidatus Portnoybacteria bacterium]MDD4982459.1 sugar transferase [Candidatus Portnoybacteria bacterium]